MLFFGRLLPFSYFFALSGASILIISKSSRDNPTERRDRLLESSKFLPVDVPVSERQKEDLGTIFYPKWRPYIPSSPTREILTSQKTIPKPLPSHNLSANNDEGRKPTIGSPKENAVRIVKRQLAVDPAGNSFDVVFAEDRQFRRQRRPRRPQKSNQRPKNNRKQLLRPANPIQLQRPLPLSTQSTNPPRISPPDISLIPLQSVEDSGSNDLLAERFPPYNDFPEPLDTFPPTNDVPVDQPVQGSPHLTSQDNPRPLSHQVSGPLAHQLPLPQLIEAPRLHPETNTAPPQVPTFEALRQPLPPSHNPLQPQPVFPVPDPPQPPPPQPTPPPLQLQPVPHPRPQSVLPLEDFSGPQTPFQDLPPPSAFEFFSQFPSQRPSEEVNDISDHATSDFVGHQEPQEPQNSPQTDFEDFFEPSSEEFPEQSFQPSHQQTPFPPPQSQFQSFRPSNKPPAFRPVPPGVHNLRPLDLRFPRPQNIQQGRPKPRPHRGGRRPAPLVRLRHTRRPRVFTTQPRPRVTATRRPRIRDRQPQGREQIVLTDGGPQSGIASSPFSSGEDHVLAGAKPGVLQKDFGFDDHDIPSFSESTFPPPIFPPLPTAPPSLPSKGNNSQGQRKPPTANSGKGARQTISKAFSRLTKNVAKQATQVAKTVTKVAGTVGQVTGRTLGEGVVLLGNAGDAVMKAVRQMDDYAADLNSPQTHTVTSGLQLTVPHDTHVMQHKFGLRFSMSSNHPGVPMVPLMGVDFDSEMVKKTRKRPAKATAFLKPYMEMTSGPVHLYETGESGGLRPQLPHYKIPTNPVRTPGGYPLTGYQDIEDESTSGYDFDFPDNGFYEDSIGGDYLDSTFSLPDQNYFSKEVGSQETFGVTYGWPSDTTDDTHSGEYFPRDEFDNFGRTEEGRRHDSYEEVHTEQVPDLSLREEVDHMLEEAQKHISELPESPSLPKHLASAARLRRPRCPPSRLKRNPSLLLDRSHFIQGPQPFPPCDPIDSIPNHPDNIQEVKRIVTDPSYPADYYSERFRQDGNVGKRPFR